VIGECCHFPVPNAGCCKSYLAAPC